MTGAHPVTVAPLVKILQSTSVMLFRTYGHRKNTQRADDLELVENEELPHRSSVLEEEEEESDTDSIPDLSLERGLRFHLQKKCKYSTHNIELLFLHHAYLLQWIVMAILRNRQQKIKNMWKFISPSTMLKLINYKCI